MTVRRWGDVVTHTQIDYTSTSGSWRGWDVAGLESGGYVVVGIDRRAAPNDDDAYFRVYDPNGNAQTGWIEIDPNSGAEILEVQVTALANGNFTIAYTRSDNAGDTWLEIRTPTGSLVNRQLYDGDNTGAVPAFDPDVTDVNENFLTLNTESGSLWGRLYTAEGNFINGPFQIATGNSSTNVQDEGEAVTNTAGNTIAVIWRDEAGSDLELRTYTTSMNTQSSTTVDSTYNGIGRAQIAPANQEDFAVVWDDNNADGSVRGIYINFFDPNANGGNVQQVNVEELGSQAYPSITPLQDGSVLITWTSQIDGVDQIRGRLFLGNGAPHGGEFRLDFDGDVTDFFPMVDLMSDGRIVMAWGSTDTQDIYTQIIDPRNGIIDGDQEANEIYGHAGLNDEIAGYGGNDRLLGLAGDDTIYGHDGNDTIFGNNGEDAMYGGSGNDILIGGRGADVHAGGTGSDTAYYLDANEGVTASLANNQLNKGWADGDTWFSIENITGTNYDDFLFGQAGGAANDLRGAAGDDDLRGYSGNDRLYGGADDDLLNGGTGADLLAGGTGFDIATYANASSGVTASLANSAVNTGEADGDTYNSIEGLIGSRFNDILNGDNGDNSVSGGAGNDFVRGYRGWDTLTGGSGVDRFVFSSSLGSANLATITDFEVNTDKIRLFESIFSAVGSTLTSSEFRANNTGQAQDSSDHIIYNRANGYVYYDEDGTGSAGRVYFARLDPGLNLDHLDFEVI